MLQRGWPCPLRRALFRDKHGALLLVWDGNISWLFDVLWQCGRWPFPWLALLIICSLTQQQPGAEWEGSSSCTGEREQLLQEPAVLEGAPSLTTDHRGATAGAQLCCHSLAQVCFKQTWPVLSESSSLAAAQGIPQLTEHRAVPSQAAWHQGCN